MSDQRMVLPAEDNFVLDDRTVATHLRAIEQYCKKIPFIAREGFWDKVIFNADQTPETLAKLYESSQQAYSSLLPDGSLLPHQAFLLAFLRMLEIPRELYNTFPARHRQLYYRGLLRLKERAITPDQVMLSFKLNDSTPELLLPAGLGVNAGQDSQGTPRHYRLDQPLLANQGRLTDIRWCMPVLPKEGEVVGQVTRVLYDEKNKVALPPLGCRLFAYDESQDILAATGRVVASEVLAMSGGERRISVEFADVVKQADIVVEVSSEGKWLTLQDDSNLEPTTALHFILPGDAGPITPSEGLEGFITITDSTPTPFPLLKISRRKRNGLSVPAITKLTAKAQNDPNVLISTDDGVSSISGRTYPFGLNPIAGLGVNITAADWCNRTGSIKLTLKPEWLDLPDKNFKDWYVNYPSQPLIEGNGTFKAKPSLVVSGDILLLKDPNAPDDPLKNPLTLPLFKDDSGTAKFPISNELVFDLPWSSSTATGSTDPRDWARYVRLDLTGQDFLHKEYWSELSNGKEEVPGLNLPYTPQWKSLCVDYQCEDTEVTQQYVLTPFGHALDIENSNSNQLYLGFEALKAAQDLSLHWQLQSPQALNIAWEYLSPGNKWTALDARIRDQTENLFHSGLWLASLPEEISTEVQAMPSGRFWIRGLMQPTEPTPVPKRGIKIGELSSDYPWLQGIHTNSALATLVDGDTLDPSHFDQPLPIGTIAQPVEKVDGLEEIAQPWPSEGGRGPEQEPAFLQRVAQRLSHRDRASSLQDIQILLQDQYPELHDIRIPSTEALSGTNTKQTHTLVVVPANGHEDNTDAVRPKFNPARLKRMQRYILDRASPWLDLQLENPQYKDVLVQYTVIFIPGTNVDYGYRELQLALERRYMPWSYDEVSTVRLGFTLDYYEVLTFLQQHALVDRVTELTLDNKTVSAQCLDTEVLILQFPAE